MSRRPRGSRACDDATAQCDNDSDISVHPAPRPRDVCRVTGSSAVVWGHESRNDCGPLAQQGSSLSSALCSIGQGIYGSHVYNRDSCIGTLNRYGVVYVLYIHAHDGAPS